jgi:hypothetical protein
LTRLIASLLLVAALLASPGIASAKPAPPPQVVIALIDTGINPYSPAFRDHSPLAYKHPSTYIPGYPADVPALRITLDKPYNVAIKKDANLWDSVEDNQLYWIPGTRIIGAMSVGPGGTHCPGLVQLPIVADEIPGPCVERKILDDHGHGTMTASRAAGYPHSLAPNARIVELEGLTPTSLTWEANQGWIDVSSNSWSSTVPHPIGDALPESIFGPAIVPAAKYISSRVLTLFASGNGAGGVAGATPTNTYMESTIPAGIVAVGGHDNGHITAWAGNPAHVVADDYGGFRAPKDSEAAMSPDPIACCTSAAAPYAAGGAAAIILQARRILGDHRTGIHNGVVARGKRGVVKSGPLADGVFTLQELKTVLFHTAEQYPRQGRDDGLIQWAGEPRAPDYVAMGPGANPFCILCTTMPVRWTDVPSGFDQFPYIGYGAINERSLALAMKVLAGKAPLPARPSDDAEYQRDQMLRTLLYP